MSQEGYKLKAALNCTAFSLLDAAVQHLLDV